MSALIGAAIVGVAALVSVPAVASDAAVSAPARAGAVSGPAAGSRPALFLQVTGVTGEATIGTQAGLIALTSYSDSYQGASATTGVGAGKATFGGLTVTTLYSKAVPQLLARLATGAVLSTVKLEALRTVRGRGLNYLTITLTNARVVSAAESSSGPLPTVKLQFLALKVCESYSPVTAAGTLGSPVTFCGVFR